MADTLLSTAPPTAPARPVADNRRLVRHWLHVVAAFMFALFVVGGATRLTESGLSITEWNPVHGVLPPLSAADWQAEFDLYRQIPQYQEINRGMSLDAFKTIYWWEWTHRLLARAIGLVFALPLVFFWLTGRLEGFLKPRLLGILALGGMQGAIGWWMVASGLVGRTDVSQYRLAIHLTLACIILSATLWVARGLKPDDGAVPPTRGSVYVGGLIALMALAQIYLGGLVAGLNAGLAFNTWPLIDGALVPNGLFVMDPTWLNFFENVKAVQFWHRTGAYALFAVVALHAIASLVIAKGTRHATMAVYLFGAVAAQALVGITTLLLHVPLGWALLHHAGGIAVLALAVTHARALKGPYALVTQSS